MLLVAAIKWTSLIILSLVLSGCGVSSSALHLLEPSTIENYSGSIVVSNSAINTVTLFDSGGSYVKILRDLNSPAEVPYAIFAGSAPSIFYTVEGSDRVESYNLDTEVYSNSILNPNLVSTPVMGITRDSAGNTYVVEGNTHTIEKFGPIGNRIGAPFIPATVAACVLNSPRNITILGNGNIAVTNIGNDRLNIYSPSGTCVATVTSAPLSAADPYGVTYDPVHNKIIVTTNATSRVVALNVDGTGIATLFLDTAIISAPTAVAVDSSGNILVANTLYDTVEKLSYTGGATATRYGTSPWIPASTFIRDPVGLAVIP